MEYFLFDNHSHIADEKFSEEVEIILERAKKEKVKYIINPSSDIKDSKNAIAIANKYDNVFAAIGIHPHEAKYFDDNTIYILRELAKNNKKVVAIGEIGLDYFYNHSPKEIQIEVFREQLRLAKDLNIPVVIHDREAHQDVMNILTEEDSFSNGVIMHCYSSSAEMGKEFVKKGAFISFSGTVTFSNAKKIVEAAKVIPMDRILIETDAPYLSPTPMRGTRNEPSYVRFTCEKLAEIKGVSFEEMANQTFNNTIKAYRLDIK